MTGDLDLILDEPRVLATQHRGPDHDSGAFFTALVRTEDLESGRDVQLRLGLDVAAAHSLKESIEDWLDEMEAEQ